MRTFIALDIADEIKSSLLDLVHRLRSREEGVGWVRRDAMHLTLKFLGEIPADRAHPVGSCLEQVASRHRTFSLCVKGTGVFPPAAAKPRILWAGIEPSPEMISFQQDIESTLEKEGFSRESRPFRPHLTLGRVRKPVRLGKILEILEDYGDREFGVMTVGSVILYESRLHTSGARHSVLREACLS